jgi:hypothetical protein
MTDFVIRERDYDKVPHLLTTEVPGFLDSEEYRLLDSEDRKVPGLVTAAFTRYFEGLREADALERCYAVIEKLAVSPDPEVQNLVVTEIFENLQGSDESLGKIREQLGPESRRLYQQWME